MDAARTHATRLIHRIGRRGAFLAFLALLDVIYSYALLYPTPRAASNPTYVFLAAVMPLWAWGLLWGAVGAICLLYALKKHDGPGYAAAMFLKVLWALMFLLGWLFADVERGYLSTAIWGAFAAVLAIIASWPEPHQEGR